MKIKNEARHSKRYNFNFLRDEIPNIKEIEAFYLKCRSNLSGVVVSCLCLSELVQNPNSNVFALAIPAPKKRPCSAPFNERAIPFRKRFGKIMQTDENDQTKKDGRTRREEKVLIEKRSRMKPVKRKNCYIDHGTVRSLVRNFNEELQRVDSNKFWGDVLKLTRARARYLTEIITWRIKLDLNGIACAHDAILPQETVRTWIKNLT